MLKDEWLMKNYDFEYLGARWATTSDQQRRKSTKKAVHPSPQATEHFVTVLLQVFCIYRIHRDIIN
jgi:hypothetical protein